MSEQDDPEKRRRRPNLAIRPMEIDDIATVFHLGEKLFTAREVPNLYRTWDEHEVIDLFHGDPEFCLVAEEEDEGAIIGFALGTTVSKSRSAWKYGHLVWLGVESVFHRLGVAERLFDHFVDCMLESGVRMLVVDTEADNLSALHFFRKMGFGHPEEHIYLALNLDTHRQQGRTRKTDGRPPLRRTRNGHA